MPIVEVIKSENSEIVISDGRFEIACLLAPLRGSKKFKVGANIKEIFAYSSSGAEILLVEKKGDMAYSVKKGEKPYEYILKGQILCKAKELVKVGGFSIFVEGLPSNVKKFDYVKFKIDRLECF